MELDPGPDVYQIDQLHARATSFPACFYSWRTSLDGKSWLEQAQLLGTEVSSPYVQFRMCAGYRAVNTRATHVLVQVGFAERYAVSRSFFCRGQHQSTAVALHGFTIFSLPFARPRFLSTGLLLSSRQLLTMWLQIMLWRGGSCKEISRAKCEPWRFFAVWVILLAMGVFSSFISSITATVSHSEAMVFAIQTCCKREGQPLK